ncbi:DNA-(apurinic or apyrimidinic site) lyase [Seinonella peptonophila]|uniref:Formamidopyrimidine-DNA glycosylase n=1 Tax=Seinonella peptonophila TaxID=112248 RepID=A0A1M4W3G3_9BACL|nr:DNA-formamidopyrimidine glycosylase [Seinonella peptonophila]SHE75737.1 DNA-(apurinic or apyrimidinic site) lyase [Seinonella peptonophila]
MPELPEVETVRRTLEKLIVGRTISDVTVRLPRIVRQPSIDLFAKNLMGKTISRVDRRGKFLKLFCEPWVLISHLRMEGKYRVVKQGEPLDRHAHILFHFDDGEELRYYDVRQFGTMDLIPAGQENQLAPLDKLGIEPFDPGFTLDWFAKQMSQKRTRCKSLLLNQEFIVGLGNIYVDEALFSAGIHPERQAASLTLDELKRLYQSIIQTLSSALEAGGSSVRSYVNGAGEMGHFQVNLQVYGRKGEPCKRCGHSIERKVVAGRGTHICPKCQQILAPSVK